MSFINGILNKFTKGEYEFATFDKKKTGLITLFLFLLPIGLYIIGYVNTGSNKNLLTVVAILGMLPASKSLVSFIMKMRVKTADADLKAKIDENMKGITGLYNIYMTSYDVNFYFDHMIILDNSLICLSTDKKFDNKKFTEHIEKHMKLDGIKDVMIKVFTDEKAYIRRLQELQSSEISKETNEQLYRLICSISL